MTAQQWKKKLQQYRDEAYEYYSRIGICPTAEEILNDICDAVEDDSGCDVDKAGEKRIARTLGLKI